MELDITNWGPLKRRTLLVVLFVPGLVFSIFLCLWAGAKAFGAEALAIFRHTCEDFPEVWAKTPSWQIVEPKILRTDELHNEDNWGV